MPIYTQIGPASYWDATSGAFSHSDFGLISGSLQIFRSRSRSCRARYGHWHADLGVTYDYLINNALLHAGAISQRKYQSQRHHWVSLGVLA